MMENVLNKITKIDFINNININKKFKQKKIIIYI